MATNFNGFWSDVSMQPKRKFRWIMGFNGVPHWIMKKASRPKISLTEAEHQFLNYKFYYPGRVEYDELSLTLADPVNPDAARTMYALLMKSGYIVPNKFRQENLGLTEVANPTPGPDSDKRMADAANQGVAVITKKAACSAISGMYLMLLDAAGAPLEEWNFYNAWIKSVDFDELDYESDDLLNLTVTIRYDWADIVGGLDRNVSVGSAGASKLGKRADAQRARANRR